MSKPYIILTGGDGGHGNLGDEFILDAVKSFYNQYQKQFNIIILKHNLPSELPNDGYIYERDFKQFFDKLNIPISKIALVHYYGGGYLNRYWYEDKIWLYRYLVSKGLEPNKFVFTGQGLGPFTQPQESELKKIAEQVMFFGVRDLTHQDKFKRAQLTFDDTIRLIKPAGNKIFKKKKIGVNLRPSAEYVSIKNNQYIEIINNIKTFASSNKYKVYFFNMVGNEQYDEYTLQENIIKSSTIEKYKIYNRDRNYKKLLKRIGSSQLIITTSYHATLSALYSKVPVISLFNSKYYKLKFEGLKNIANSNLLQINSVDDLDAPQIKEASLSANKCNINETGAIMDELKLKNQYFYDIISSYLDNYSSHGPNKI